MLACVSWTTRQNTTKRGAMSTLREIIDRWREQAVMLREEFADERAAHICEVHARQLEEYLERTTTRAVTLDEAADISGYSKVHIRRLMDSGKIQNVGKPGAPRVLVTELPRKVVDEERVVVEVETEALYPKREEPQRSPVRQRLVEEARRRRSTGR